MGMSKEEANKIAAEEGWFNSLAIIDSKVGLGNEKAAALKAGFFKLILAKVEEAKTEVARLQAVVNRLEAAARAGTVVKPGQGKIFLSDDVVRLRKEVEALHGWTISLLESDISILMAADNPKRAGDAVRGLQRSFAELFALRVQDGFKMMARHPEVFDRVLGK